MTVRLSHTPKTCSVDGCGGKHQARGFCQKHYTRLLKHGDVFDTGSRVRIVDGQRVCKACSQPKESEAFASASNGNRRAVCKACQKAQRAAQSPVKHAALREKQFRARMRRIKLNEDGTATVKLTKGYEAIIDMVDVAKVYRHSWHAAIQPDGRVYAVAWAGPKGARTVLRLHRVVLGLPDDVLADHKNGHTLDCRKSNLRAASSADNARNAGWRGSSSGFKGVTKMKKNGRFRAQIRYLDTLLCLGEFDTPEEAAQVYDAKARELHGEFACVNFPIGNERPARSEGNQA